MGRENYRYVGQTDFRGGINQEPENARPNQVLDALNVWCPNGILEHRPSFRGVGTLKTQGVTGYTNLQLIKEDNTTSTPSYSNVSNITGTYVSKTNTRTGDRLYIGIDGLSATEAINQLIFSASGAGTGTSTLLKIEVYTTSGWLTLDHVTLIANNTFSSYFVRESQEIFFCWPNNYTSLTINSVTRSAWLRVEFLNDDAVLGAQTVTVSLAGASITTFIKQLIGISNTNIIYGFNFSEVSKRANYFKQVIGEDVNIESLYNSGDVFSFSLENGGILSFVEIPQFDEVFVATGYKCLSKQVVEKAAGLGDTVIGLAEVEDRPEFVGTVEGIKSDFHPDIIPQLGSWPQAQHYLYHQGTLFAANMIDDKQLVRWSAPEPAYKVWPAESFAYIVGEDRSDITGLAVLNENVIIFKQDSIWQLVDIGEDDLGLRQFSPRLIKQGVGCVSANSIQNIPGGLVFLAEDGIYFCDGTPDVRKISQPIDLTIKTINSSYRYLSASTHVRSKQCYILSVPSGANTFNNLTLVYDYKHNSWWKWDGITPQGWFAVNSQFNAEEVYFVDHLGQLMQMDKAYSGSNAFEICATVVSGNTTGGSYILSHRFGYGTNSTKLWGDITLDGNARMSCEAHVLVQDEDPPASAVNLSFTDSTEDTWGGTDQWDTATWVKTKRRSRRLCYRKHGEWAQFRIENFGVGAQLRSVQLGYIPLGVR